MLAEELQWPHRKSPIWPQTPLPGSAHSQSLIPGLPVLGSPQMPTRTAVLLPGARRALTYVPRALGIQQSVLTSALLQGPGLSLTLAED